MLPNLSVHIAFGKVLFASADIAVALLVQHMVQRKCDSQKLSTAKTQRIVLVALAAWLFNPYTATISTRGNGDSLVVLMQLGVLLLLQPRPNAEPPAVTTPNTDRTYGSSQPLSPGTGRMAAAGALYGLLVHWRVFPVIYGPSLILFFWSRTHRVRRSSLYLLAKWSSICQMLTEWPQPKPQYRAQ